jgi:hypothetical protein
MHNRPVKTKISADKNEEYNENEQKYLNWSILIA